MRPRRRKKVALSSDSDEMSAPSPPQSEAGGALAPPTTRQPVGDWRLEIAGVVVLALVPRIIYLTQIQRWPLFYHPVLDSRTQYKWATILLHTSGIGNREVLAKAPLYSYFLAFHQWVFVEGPESLFAARLLQLLLGAAICGLTYLLGRHVFGRPVGLAAGVLAALYSPAVYREGQLLDTAIATFLTVTFLLVLLRVVERPTRGAWFGAGLLLGVLALTRPNLLLLAVLAVALMAAWVTRGEGAKRWVALAGVFLLGLVLPIIPITARNYLLIRKFVPISATGGINLYTGNNPNADGYSPIPSGIAWERTWYQAIRAGRTDSRAQDAYWREQAFRFWRERPAQALALLAKKVYLYWNAYEIPNNVSYEWGRTHSSVLRMLPLTFAVIGPLGLLGIALSARRSRAAWLLALFVLTQMAAVVVFFVCGRYRMPALPVVCVFAGFVLAELGRLVQERGWGRLALGLVGLAAFAVLVNSDAYGVRRISGANRDSYYLGQSYLLAQDYEKAKDAFRGAVQRRPRDADAYALLGQVEAATDEPKAAAEHLAQALTIAPDHTTTAVKLAALHLERGWPLEEPERLLRRALEAQPTHLPGLTALARLNVRQGDLDQARRSLDAIVPVLRRISLTDTRIAPAVTELLAVAQEARDAGVDVPAELSGRADASRRMN